MMCNFTEAQAAISDPSIEQPYCRANKAVIVLEAIFLALVVVGSIAANSFVLILVAKFKELRYRSIIVSLSAVVCDLLLVLVFHLPALISVSRMDWPFGADGCTILGFVAFYLIYVRWMAMAVISLDRFFYILFTFTYRNWSRPFLVTLTIMAWTIPFLLNVPSLFGFGSYSFRPGFSQCTIDCGDNKDCYALFVTAFSLQFAIGALVPTCLYVIMYSISQSKKKKRRITMGSSLQVQLSTTSIAATNAVTATTNIDDATSPSSSSGDGASISIDTATTSVGGNDCSSNSTERQISNGSSNDSIDVRNGEVMPGRYNVLLFWSKQDISALVTFLLVFVTLVLTNTPVYAVTIMRRGFPEQYRQIPIWAHFLIVDLFYLSNMLDPLFIMRNRDFRKAIMKMWNRASAPVTTTRRASMCSATLNRVT